MTQVIIHIDLDFFYGQVEQAANPSLISLPFAIQQKHIVVTCNYLARAAGVKKLQLLTDARRNCPRLVIVNGEDIQRYRDASKAVFRHVRSLVGEKVQRLGMDELWLDVTDHVERHCQNLSAVSDSQGTRIFELSEHVRFEYDSTEMSGHVIGSSEVSETYNLLKIAAHLAAFLRESIRSEFSFTSSGGISTSKLLAKLVGDQHKPNDQTTLLPSHHQAYLDRIEVKKIAGVGYKLLSILYEKLPEMIKPVKRSVETPFDIRGQDEADEVFDFEAERDAEREAEIMREEAADLEDEEIKEDSVDDGEEFKLVSKQKEDFLSKNKRPLTVLEVRSRVTLELLRSWIGNEQGDWLWSILHAKDDSVVIPSALYPKSIGVEDSFLHCTTIHGVRDHLLDLTTDLVYRMENDLTENGKFMRFPSILRLTPRFRGDQDKGELWRHKRTSRGVPFPVDALSPQMSASDRVQVLVDKILLPLFCKIAEGKGNWDLSLLNVGVADFKTSAPSSGIFAYLASPSTENPGIKRKATHSNTIHQCPTGFDQDVWVALDEQSRKELLGDQENLFQQIHHKIDQQETRVEVKKRKTVEGARPKFEQVHSRDGDGFADDSWPEDDDVGYLCTKCSSVIPEFAMEDHTCIVEPGS